PPALRHARRVDRPVEAAHRVADDLAARVERELERADHARRKPGGERAELLLALGRRREEHLDGAGAVSIHAPFSSLPEEVLVFEAERLSSDEDRRHDVPVLRRRTTATVAS